MIPNFKEYIKEGLWSKGIERSKTGEERLGDKLVTNIDQLNWIDLGFDFLISDVNFEIDGNEKITYIELENAFSHIKSKGCRVPGWHELKSSLLKSQGTPLELYDWLKVYTKSEQRGTHVYLESDKTHKKVEFYIDNPYGQSYWCRYDKTSLEKNSASIQNARIMRINDPKYAYEGMLFSFENEDKNEKLKVRLVKDKHVYEGLWSKGIERSKTGEERLEDKSPMYMVCKKMSKFLSEHYKIPDEDLCSVLDIEKEEKHINFIIGIHVKNTNFTLNCQVPIIYKDDEIKTADCLYDSIVGEHLFGDQKDPGGKGRIIRIMIKGIKKLYGF